MKKYAIHFGKQTLIVYQVPEGQRFNFNKFYANDNFDTYKILRYATLNIEASSAFADELHIIQTKLKNHIIKSMYEMGNNCIVLLPDNFNFQQLEREFYDMIRGAHIG